VPLELADVLRAHGEEFRRLCRPTRRQLAVMAHIEQCRTAALGGHAEACGSCGHVVKVSYNSCRDRHCSKCQGEKRVRWVESRLARILPVPHFHVVFTVPHELNPVMLRNKRATFDILFRAAAETLSTIALDEKRLGAEIGFTAVLHTWGQNLLFHPHLHCVVTGGGLAPDGAEWVPAREKYLLPVRILGKMFRGKFLDYLGRACAGGMIDGGFDLAAVKARLYRRRWVVYAKPPFGGVEAVIKYLGRYTHRVAISNSRLVSMESGRVTFTWKDYRDGGRAKVMTLGATEFIRRFLLHVLPRGYTRIRHYGLMAPANVNAKLQACRELLSAEGPAPEDEPAAETSDHAPEPQPPPVVCPVCGCTRMVRVRLEPLPTRRLDSS
jgi:hypothetical protein